MPQSYPANRATLLAAVEVQEAKHKCHLVDSIEFVRSESEVFLGQYKRTEGLPAATRTLADEHDVGHDESTDEDNNQK